MKNKYINCGKDTILIINNKVLVFLSTESVEIVKSYTWCLEGTGYVMSRTKGKAVKIHRLIIGAKKGDYVDHADGNILDNRLHNLRICTKQENAFNSKIRADNKTGYKGVSWSKQAKKYRAYINYDGKQIHLGLFKDKKSAAISYNKKAQELFKEFARLNLV